MTSTAFNMARWQGGGGGGGLNKSGLCWRGMDIFWNYTFALRVTEKGK